MSAFWKKDKKEDKENPTKKDGVVVAEKGEEKSQSVEKKSKKKNVKKKDSKTRSKKKDKGLVVPEEKATLINKVLVKPMISEAVMRAQELGKYTFKVTPSATKKEVALAVESLYNVTVRKVNIVNYKAQSKMFRGIKGSRKGYKKAIVSLRKGDKIKLF